MGIAKLSHGASKSGQPAACRSELAVRDDLRSSLPSHSPPHNVPHAAVMLSILLHLLVFGHYIVLGSALLWGLLQLVDLITIQAGGIARQLRWLWMWLGPTLIVTGALFHGTHTGETSPERIDGCPPATYKEERAVVKEVGISVDSLVFWKSSLQTPYRAVCALEEYALDAAFVPTNQCRSIFGTRRAVGRCLERQKQQ